jgi:hypothetical protein
MTQTQHRTVPTLDTTVPFDIIAAAPTKHLVTSFMT